MRFRGCVVNLLFIAVILVAFGASSYFSFRFFVRGESVMTPKLSGKSVSEARALASDVGLALEEAPEQDRYSDEVPPGTIVWQSPRAGALVKHGSRLLVARSQGPIAAEVPDLKGESPRSAMLQFSQRGFGLGAVSQISVGGAPVIVTSSPPPGTVGGAELPVSLLVSTGRSGRKYVMPDLINYSIEHVRSVLVRGGFDVANVRYESYPGIREGTVIRQFPVPGAPLTEEDVITLTVSRGDEGLIQEHQPSLHLGRELGGER
jgi:eukaryotic-like serine/threonine-protein kinase